MTPEKTPEQLMEELRNGTVWIDRTPKPPNHHQMALLAAQTLPNQSAAELLASADKIEAWLRKPEMDEREMLRKMRDEFYAFGDQQKSPEKINPEASDGVSGD